MPRSANQLAAVELKVRTTEAIMAYLKGLVASGLYGKTPNEAADRLLSEGIERLIREGTLKRM